ncbi:ras GTPase-activating protein-binding protein 2-like [Conger conger]|uniref:ras GTPase-activating protein-binding protein 2-like n=1 Tax=Conger conger TaxID=82655 RepID=UPI002A598A40|nr:ras GTPase-activating protein-binding protein 2-like [Conger conger]XP_061102292.1 ras GTPase-activating protein-binding protein 2-like [Conger conger]
MVMEKPSPLLVGREFVRQYYTLLNKAPDYLHRFYGKNSSYVHSGLDGSVKLEEAVFGQAEIHRKVMSLQFSECRTKIRHVDAHATLSDSVVVQVMGEISNSGQPMRRFMQTFVLAPEGSVANKFYVHNDIFRYEDEVFDDSETELDEESEDEVEEEHAERPASPQILQDSPRSTPSYEPHPASNSVEELLEEDVPEPQPELEPEQTNEEVPPETRAEEKVPEELEETVTPVPAEPVIVVQEPVKPFSWASVTSKNLPPSGMVPAVVPHHVAKARSSQTRGEMKREATPFRTQDQRPRPGFAPRGSRSDGGTPSEARKPQFSFLSRGRGDSEAGDGDGRRPARHPDSHQLFVGNLPHDIDETELKDFFMTFGNVVELRINTKALGGRLPNFGFVVFDQSDPVQKILDSKPLMFNGEVRLNVEEKKARSPRDREARVGDERWDVRRGDRASGGPRGPLGSGTRDRRAPPSRGGVSPKPGLNSGRGAGPGESRFTTQRH